MKTAESTRWPGEAFRIYRKAFVAPATAFRQLLSSPHYFALGFAYMLIPIVGYTLMYVFLTIAHGAPSVFTPWLNIPAESYYAANRFLLAPGMVLAWVFAAGAMQVLSRLGGGAGSFEEMLAASGLAISVAMWAGLLHDLPMSVFSALGILDARQHEIDMNRPTLWRTLLWVAYLAYAILFFVLFPMAVSVVQRISPARSIAIGALGFVLFQIVFLIFNR